MKFLSLIICLFVCFFFQKLSVPNSLPELITDDFIIDESTNISLPVLFPHLKRMTITRVKSVNPNVLRKLKYPTLPKLCLTKSLVDYTGSGERTVPTPVPVLGDPASFAQAFFESFTDLTDLRVSDHLMGSERVKCLFTCYASSTSLKTLK